MGNTKIEFRVVDIKLVEEEQIYNVSGKLSAIDFDHTLHCVLEGNELTFIKHVRTPYRSYDEKLFTSVLEATDNVLIQEGLVSASGQNFIDKIKNMRDFNINPSLKVVIDVDVKNAFLHLVDRLDDINELGIFMKCELEKFNGLMKEDCDGV